MPQKSTKGAKHERDHERSFQNSFVTFGAFSWQGVDDGD
jgi:hypothetical protein